MAANEASWVKSALRNFQSRLNRWPDSDSDGSDSVENDDVRPIWCYRGVLIHLFALCASAS
jgi:hypothetical protein